MADDIAELKDSVNELNAKIDKFMSIMEEALEALKSGDSPVKGHDEKLDKILEQNADIADGIVALADIVEELKESASRKAPSSLPPLRRPPIRIPPPIGPRVPPPPEE